MAEADLSGSNVAFHAYSDDRTIELVPETPRGQPIQSFMLDHRSWSPLSGVRVACVSGDRRSALNFGRNTTTVDGVSGTSTEQTPIAEEIAVAVGSASADNPAFTVATSLARALGLPIRVIHVRIATDGAASAAVEAAPMVERVSTMAPSVAVSFERVEATDVVDGLVGALDARSLAVLKSDNANRWSAQSSIAEGVVDAFHGLVAIVGPALAGQETPAGPVVVAVDGSNDAERALPIAGALADRLGVAPIAVRALAISAEASDADAAQSYLDSLDGFESLLVRSNDPISALTGVANEQNASLLVLSSHGDRATKRATISRTSMGLVHDATMPVVLVGPEVVGG